jgi:hypothetical protein
MYHFTLTIYAPLHCEKISIMQGGASSGYKKYVSENGTEDDTYSDNGVALFRVQGSGPENMQAIQVDTVHSVLIYVHWTWQCAHDVMATLS